MPYQSTDSLNRRIESLRQPWGGGSMTAGLAQAIRSRKANKLEKELSAVEEQNQQNQQRELAMILRGQQTGRVGDSYASATAEQFTPTDPELRQITAKMLMDRATGSNTPSNVREWEYFSKLPQSQQEQYLNMRRGMDPINLGDRFIVPSVVNPAGTPRASFDVGLRPQDTPEVRGQQAAAVEAAQTAAIPQQMAAETQGLADRTAAQAQQRRSVDAASALELLDLAEPLLDVATGSGIGAGRDMVLGAFGMSTDAGEAAAQLKALGGLLVSKMPRMEGPQSNYDQQLYREMAGQIGDPTIPNDVRKAALQTIRQLNEKYATSQPVGAAPTGARLRFNPATGELE